MKYLITLILILGAFVAGMYVMSANDIEERFFKQYQHGTFYEDGSYRATDIYGIEVTGCVAGGLCND